MHNNEINLRVARVCYKVLLFVNTARISLPISTIASIDHLKDVLGQADDHPTNIHNKEEKTAPAPRRLLPKYTNIPTFSTSPSSIYWDSTRDSRSTRFDSQAFLFPWGFEEGCANNYTRSFRKVWGMSIKRVKCKGFEGLSD